MPESERYRINRPGIFEKGVPRSLKTLERRLGISLTQRIVDGMTSFNITRLMPQQLSLFGQRLYQLQGRELCVHGRQLKVIGLAASLDILAMRLEVFTLELRILLTVLQGVTDERQSSSARAGE